MKKIALLFTLFLTVNTFNGMQRDLEPEKPFPLGELPVEAKAIITQAISTYNTLDDIIKTIEATKLINREFNNIIKNVYGDYNKIKEFTTLVHRLSDKFPEATTETIAKKFEITTAQKYVELGNKLLILSGSLLTTALNDTKQVIEEGADVNFTTSRIVDPTTGAYHIYTPIFFALQLKSSELIKLLATSGIKVKTIHTMHETLKKIQEAREAAGIQ